MDISWEYIAGFFDGEGSISVTHGTGRLAAKMSLHQSRPRGLRLLTEIQEFLDDLGITARISSREYQTQTHGEQVMHRLYIYRRIDGLAFIEGMMPYLRIKKIECQDMHRWMRMYPPIPTSKFAAYVPERTVCSNGHVLSPDNIYLMKMHGTDKRWKACRKCRLDERQQNYRTVIRPVMAAYGLGMREVSAEVIARARQEGIICQSNQN